MKILKSTINGVIIFVLLAIVGLFSISLLPIEGNIKIKIVKSGSMEPAIRTGGIVIIKPAQEYKVGEIITFGIDTKDSIPTTHRVVSINGASYLTKGDANDNPDPVEIDRSTIIGKVLFTVPYAGYVLDFARQPIGFIVLIAVPAGLVVVYEIVAIIEEAKKMRNKKNT